MTTQQRLENVRLLERVATLQGRNTELLKALDELVAEFDSDSERAAQEQGCNGLNETSGIQHARELVSTARGDGIFAYRRQAKAKDAVVEAAQRFIDVLVTTRHLEDRVTCKIGPWVESAHSLAEKLDTLAKS
ncbi:hypothetical protein LCGC14_1902380 [marine sediment metagenome]|uniref:Uncharacterized protein n=1 Tax=marine sediment metagenome TaxID=412755 RepID=A0A0F9GJI4_9ZZZZ